MNDLPNTLRELAEDLREDEIYLPEGENYDERLRLIQSTRNRLIQLAMFIERNMRKLDME